MTKTTKWTKVEDFRDDASVCNPTWELSAFDDELGETTFGELPPAPEQSRGEVWRSGDRWLCR
jgi:hypothetical protein